MLDGVIGAHRDSVPARGSDELGGLIDCFVSSGRRRLSANASSAAIHRGPCLSERTGDPAPGTSSRARDYRYFLLECCHGGSLFDAEHGHHRVAGMWEDVAVRHPIARIVREDPSGVATDASSILALGPDLVVGTLSSSPEVVYELQAAGIPVFRLDTLVTRLDQVAENISVLDYITGQDELASQARERFEAEIAAIAEQCAARRPRSRIFGHSMTGFSYGDQTLFHDVVRLVGGINVAAEGGLHTFERIEREDVMEWNPEWVFTWAVPRAIRLGVQWTDSHQETSATIVDIDQDSDFACPGWARYTPDRG